MKFKWGSIIAVSAIIALLTAGCAEKGLKKLPEMTESQIWQEVHHNVGSIQDFSGSAELTVESGIKVISIQAEVKFKMPDWLTVRTFGPMGLRLVEASLQGNKFKVYSPFTNEYITGSLDSVDLSTSFKLPFPNLDIRAAWVRLFNPSRPESAPASVRAAGKYYILSYQTTDGFHEIWVDSRKMNLNRENLLDSQGVVEGYIAYSKYMKKKGIRFPRLIEIGDIPMGVKLTIEMQKFRVNEDLADSEMMLSIPPNVNRINIQNSPPRQGE